MIEMFLQMFNCAASEDLEQEWNVFLGRSPSASPLICSAVFQQLHTDAGTGQLPAELQEGVATLEVLIAELQNLGALRRDQSQWRPSRHAPVRHKRTTVRFDRFRSKGLVLESHFYT